MKKNSESIAEVLFFRTYFAYLLQNPALKDEYNMLVDHYNNYPDSFKILTKYDLQKIKQIQEDLKNNRYSLFSGSIDFSKEPTPEIKNEKTDLKHKELCNQILLNKDKLFKDIISGALIYSSREHPTRFGPIDIVLQNEEGIAYIIEVKTSCATHAIIGQVIKYFIGLSLKLTLRHFYEVKIITLCPSYDEPSYKGLLQIGAIPLILKNNPLSIINNLSIF